jgi:lipopolysaccharide/colanic/teichoic acid biosynthesis glycosyltransferase
MTSPLRQSLAPHSSISPADRDSDPVAVDGLLSRDTFAHTLYIERKRTERSGRSFVLMLLESSKLLKLEGDRAALLNVLRALAHSSRDTDARGWYKEGFTIGVIFTELGANVDGHAVASALLTKVTKALTATLSIGQIKEIRLTFHVFPENLDQQGESDDSDSKFYDDLLFETAPKRLPRAAKRFMDVTGSLGALLFGLPLFAAVALAVKLTSKGPVFFRQERLGQYGRKFTFLKFRSMCVNNDATIHQEFVKRLIAGDAGENQSSAAPTYKLTADPRVTPIGRVLRKTSLDELPQFINVLIGDMSLVGPRPPVPYETECYRIWHRTRLLGAKPGITGLWQVAGRSRVKFDDMVRMDLQYAKSWSLWLDVKILLLTPVAVLTANGAH